MKLVIGHPVALCWPADGATVKKIIRYSYENSYFIRSCFLWSGGSSDLIYGTTPPASRGSCRMMSGPEESGKSHNHSMAQLLLSFMSPKMAASSFVPLVLLFLAITVETRPSPTRHEVQVCGEHLSDRYHQATITDPHPHLPLPLSCPHLLHLHCSHPQPDNHDNSTS